MKFNRPTRVAISVVVGLAAAVSAIVIAAISIPVILLSVASKLTSIGLAAAGENMRRTLEWAVALSKAP